MIAYQLNNIFATTRLVIRLNLKNNFSTEVEDQLSDAFARLMKAIQGRDRLSEDIQYLRLRKTKIRDKYKSDYLDVLFFIKSSAKIEDTSGLVREIGRQWGIAIDSTKTDSNIDTLVVLVESIDSGEILMDSIEVLNTSSLLIQENDAALISAVKSKLIPYFMGYTVFLPYLKIKKGNSNHRQITVSALFKLAKAKPKTPKKIDKQVTKTDA